jgi:hypothetical protein
MLQTLTTKNIKFINITTAIITFIASLITIASLFISLPSTGALALVGKMQHLIVITAPFLLGACIPLVILTSYNLLRSKNSKLYSVTQFTGRESYIDVIIDWAGKFERSMVFCVDTLAPSRKGGKIKRQQEKLQAAKGHGKDVRFLAPKERDKLEAGYELTRIRGIPTRFLTYIGDGDLRFALVDTNISIIAIGEHNAPSQGCVVIESERLKMLLQRYFDELWENQETKDYDTFLREEINNLRDPNHPLSHEKLSERLHLPVTELERILTNFP